jgi:hypothetical protein
MDKTRDYDNNSNNKNKSCKLLAVQNNGCSLIPLHVQCDEGSLLSQLYVINAHFQLAKYPIFDRSVGSVLPIVQHVVTDTLGKEL